MYGISAAYIQASKGVTDPNMRKMIRYCVMDTFIPLALYRKFYKGFSVLVMKRSGKPFKCGKIVAAVVGYTVNPHCPKQSKAALMQDGTVVNLNRLTYKV